MDTRIYKTVARVNNYILSLELYNRLQRSKELALFIVYLDYLGHDTTYCIYPQDPIIDEFYDYKSTVEFYSIST